MTDTVFLLLVVFGDESLHLSGHTESYEVHPRPRYAVHIPKRDGCLIKQLHTQVLTIDVDLQLAS